MLTNEQIIKKAHEAGLYQDEIHTQLPLWVLTQQELERFARAIEAEVRKQDDALILQLVEALEQSQPYVESCANGKRVQWWGAQLDRAQDAINAGRARLGEKT